MGSQPRSVRFEDSVSKRLTQFVAAHRGMSGSSAANLFADEALRMEEHPGVVFRHGPAGRRAVIMGGPDGVGDRSSSAGRTSERARPPV